MTPKTKFGSLAWLIVLAGVLSLGSARANNNPGLYLGGPFSSVGSVGGGNITNSTWTPTGGSQENLLFVYCIDIIDDVPVPQDYPTTTATTNGVVTMTSADPSTPGLAIGPLTNYLGQTVVGDVAWLLDNYAIGQANTINTTQDVNLQLAIWTVIYGDQTIHSLTGVALTTLDNNVDLVGTGGAAGTAAGGLNNAINAANTDPSNFLWFTPTGAGTLPNQALVGYVPGPTTRSVPEPGTTVLLGAFLAVASLGFAAKRKLA